MIDEYSPSWAVFGVGFGVLWPSLYFGLHLLLQRRSWWWEIAQDHRNDICHALAISLTANICLAWMLWH